MTTPALPRNLAVVGLVASSLLLVVYAVTQPDLTGSGRAVLTRLHDQGVRAGVSLVAFTVAQLPYAAAAVGIGHLLRNRAPRLGAWGAGLSVAGAFGHAVFGGISLTYLVMAHDAHRAAYGPLVGVLQTSPVQLFSVLGLAGFAIGLLVLSIGLFRGRVGPRWTGPAIWAFLVLEFLGGALSPAASYLAATVLLVVFLTLAREALASWDGEPAVVDEGVTA